MLWHRMRVAPIALLASSLLVFSACDQQPVSPTASLDQAGTLSWDDSVATPAGWRPRACVHEVPNGAHVSVSGRVTRLDGSTFQVPKCLHIAHPNGLRFGRGAPRVAPTNSGWMEYAYTSLSGNSYHQLTAGWRVPARPTGTYAGTQVYYSFPGLENGSYIIQPVIQYGYNNEYGGSYWTAVSWRCNDGTDCTHGTPVTINPADSVIGSVTASACVNGTCTWTISTVDVTQGTRSDWTVDDAENYDWSTGGAVEVYGLNTCSQYPVNGVFYSGISLFDKYGTHQSPSWGTYVQPNPSPSCSFSVATTTTTASLYHNPPPPPPPLSNGIFANPPSYMATPTGGYTPYTYYWEWCAIECDGDPLSPAGGVNPDEVAHGWQFLSTSQQTTWSKRDVTLRNTVTDAHSAQAVATHYVP